MVVVVAEVEAGVGGVEAGAANCRQHGLMAGSVRLVTSKLGFGPLIVVVGVGVGVGFVVGIVVGDGIGIVVGIVVVAFVGIAFVVGVGIEIVVVAFVGPLIVVVGVAFVEPLIVVVGVAFVAPLIVVVAFVAFAVVAPAAVVALDHGAVVASVRPEHCARACECAPWSPRYGRSTANALP